MNIRITLLLLTTLALHALQAQVKPTQAVDFIAIDIEGNTRDLFDVLDNQNKYVAIEFFFDEPASIGVAPKVQGAYEYFGCGEYDVQFLAMNYGESNADCLNFIQENGMTYITISGQEGGGTAICNTYEITAYPTLMLIAPDHTIVEQDIWPISSAQTIIDIFEAYGIEEHSCGGNDSLALVALYNATNGDNWTDNENWLTDTPLDDWFGVNTDGNGNVITINLSGNNLTGELPIEIGNMLVLDTLILGSNNIYGSIPKEICNLTSLEVLGINENQITGIIPIEIGNLINLKILCLGGNQLSGTIPSEIGSLVGLVSICLSLNQLTGSIPASIWDLVNLNMLILSSNQLEGNIPPEIGNLVNMHNLGLSNNQFTGNIPQEINNLTGVWDIWLNDNQFTGSVPIGLEDFFILDVLHLENNKLDSFPSQLSNLSLVYSNGSNNYFTFEDLLNFPVDMVYNPQKTIHIYDTSYLLAGQEGSIQLSFDNEVQNSTYKWYKEGSLIGTTTENSIEVIENYPGTFHYNLEITNTDFSDFTLEVDSVIVIVQQNDISFEKQHQIHGDSSIMWGDYNNDGYLDLLLNDTYSYFYDKYTRIYKNHSGDSLVEVLHDSLQGVTHSSTKWGDYNNDGFLDIMLTGWIDHGNDYFSMLYFNDGNENFIEQPQIDIVNVSRSSVDWGDYNNDGFRDLMIAGKAAYEINETTKIYLNTEGTGFVEQDIDLAGVYECSVEWGDYNNDGFLDILLKGTTSNYESFTAVYKNDGNNSFTELENIDWSLVHEGQAKWGDYNNDGLLDVFLGGYGGIKIYKNIGNDLFQNAPVLNIDLYRVTDYDLGDIDNDGLLDIVITGDIAGPNYDVFTYLYKNNGNDSFSLLENQNLPGIWNGSIEFGDFDNDLDLDIALASYNNTEVSGIYINDIDIPNSPPIPPDGLSAEIINDTICFSWNRSSDNETPSLGLSYNISIGSSSGAIDLKSPQSDLNTGFHRIAHRGMIQDTFWMMKLPESIETWDYVYWSVQAIDNGFLASEFSVEDSVLKSTVLIPSIFINPDNESVFTNEIFTTTIEISSITNIGGFELELNYNPALLQANSVILGDFLGGTGREIFPLVNNIDNSTGLIEFAVITLGDSPAGPNGDGILLNIEWTSTSTLEDETITDLLLQNIQVTEPNGTVLPVEIENAIITISPCYIHDFDCDCDVDIIDVTMIAYHYGTETGDENYDLTFDLDADGDIDIVDMAMVGYDYNWTCSNKNSNAISLENVNNNNVLLSFIEQEVNSNDNTFQIELYVENIEQLGGYELELGFNPDELQITSVEEGGFLESTGRKTLSLQNNIDNEHGIISFSTVTLGSEIGGANGKGLLVIISCKALQQNYKLLSLEIAQLVRVDAKVIDYVFKTREIDLTNIGETCIVSTYPSPFKDEMSIQYNVAKEAKIAFKFYNIYGALVKTTEGIDREKGNYTKTFDGFDLSTGVYIVSLEQNGIIVDTRRIIVK